MERVLHFGLPLINDDSKRVKRRMGGNACLMLNVATS
jgi:hypothetical protein